MAGKPGRSGGWNRLSVEQHVRQGTYRGDRHGPLPGPVSATATVLPMPTRDAEWRPRPKDVAKLGTRAKALLDAVLARNELDAVEGRLLFVALASLTRMEALEAAIELDGMLDTAGTPRPLLVALAREQRSFVAAWALLRLE